MKNWKTTLSGSVAAVFLALAAVPGLADYKALLEALAALAVAGLAFTAKDHDVVGGKRQ